MKWKGGVMDIVIPYDESKQVESNKSARSYLCPFCKNVNRLGKWYKEEGNCRHYCSCGVSHRFVDGSIIESKW